MKNIVHITFLLAILPMLLLTSCANYNPWSIIGINSEDLKQPNLDKEEKVFDLSYDDAFNKVLTIAKQQNLVIFQASKWRRFIVIMGLEKQVDTTRVGIFFESQPEGKIKITISSLSHAATSKAALIIFKGLENQ